MLEGNKKVVSLEEWFPTAILSVNAEHLCHIAQYLFNETDFVKHKNDQYNENGYTTYFSNTKLPLIPEVNIFKESLIEYAAILANAQGADLVNNKIIVSNMWLNLMNTGCKHNAHIHPNSHFSGTFYLNNPIGASRIRFYNPIEGWEYCKPPTIDPGNRISCSYVEHKPSPGKLLIWNPWLKHEVLENASVEPRLSISFNFNIVSK
jgi:uncharacterized protein (TIGR02466 family)